MGYTHYWHVAKDINDSQWQTFTDFVRDAIKADGTPVAREYDDPASPPAITDELVAFNGIGADGHETFFVDRAQSGFSFCKTARKPYDTLVVACCIAGKDSGVFKYWSSDGDDEDHEAGRELFERVSGKPAVACG